MAKTSKPKGFEKLTDPEQHLVAGPGGATHQIADAAQGSLTTNQGVIVADNQNTLKSGGRGPSLLEDFAFREKITHFDHERIPERIVHAGGSGAHGYFEVTNPIPHAGFVPRREGQDHGSLRAVLHRRRRRGRRRPAARCSWLCGQILHRRGQFRSRWQQHPRLLHPGCDQVSRSYPFGQNGARPRLSPGRDGP